MDSLLLGQPTFTGMMLVFLLIASIWSMIWQGIALWHSAQAKQKNWYIAMLVLNTLGLLPIIYLIWFRQKPKKKK